MAQPITKADYAEALAILRRMLANLRATVLSSNSNTTGVLLQTGLIDALGMNAFQTLSTSLLKCFYAAVAAGATFDTLEMLRAKIVAEAPQGLLANAVVQLGLSYCLSAQVRVLTATDFVSRDDVEVAVQRIDVAFDAAEDNAADSTQNDSYLKLIALHAAAVRDLLNRSRPLGRMISYAFNESRPTLWIANRLYSDASRSDELIAENKIVHPAFAPTAGRGLSK